MSQISDDLTLPEQPAGILFRAEMASQNFVLGYWKGIVGLVVAGLVGVLIYGQYSSMTHVKQQAWAADIAHTEFSQRDALRTAARDPESLTEDDRAGLLAAAQALETIAVSAGGGAAVEANLKAADLYRVLGDNTAELAAYAAAIPHADGELLFAAQAGHAALLLDTGDEAASVAEWTALSSAYEGYLGAWATLNLARTQAVLGHEAAAAAAYDDLLTRFPGTSLTATATDERTALAVSPPADVAPAPATVPSPPAPAPAPADAP